MSQFCPKVNTKVLRLLDAAIIHSNIYIFSFVFFLGGGGGGMKHFLNFVGCEIFWGPFWGVPILLRMFSNNPPPPHGRFCDRSLNLAPL